MKSQLHQKALQPLQMKNRIARRPPYNALAVRLLCCIIAAGITLVAYIDKQNELTELRLAIPTLARKVKGIQEENIRLKYEVERFESPIHLMELMRKPEFGHLKYPYLKDEIFLPAKSQPLPSKDATSSAGEK